MINTSDGQLLDTSAPFKLGKSLRGSYNGKESYSPNHVINSTNPRCCALLTHLIETTLTKIIDTG